MTKEEQINECWEEFEESLYNEWSPAFEYDFTNEENSNIYGPTYCIITGWWW